MNFFSAPEHILRRLWNLKPGAKSGNLKNVAMKFNEETFDLSNQLRADMPSSTDDMLTHSLRLAPHGFPYRVNAAKYYCPALL